MPVLYCTPTDIREAIGGTDEGTGTCYELGDDQLNQAIGRASTLVSAYTGTTYAPDASDPVVAVPGLVYDVTLALSLYYATLTYRKNRPLQQGDPILLGYADAMSTLKGIQSGQISVDPPTPGGGTDPGTATEAARVINTVPRVFSGRDSGTELTPSGAVRAVGAYGSGWGW